jgi:UDP-2,4-diacetamido-2,4,6-trideoxy-beta-L-altropyranose hydrolase
LFNPSERRKRQPFSGLFNKRKMKMRIFIFTEGGKNIGFGHIARCLGLYQAFKERNLRVELIINADKSVESLLKKENYVISNWLAKRKKAFNLINDKDIVIIDSYLADLGFYKKVAALVKLAVFIDDNKRLNYPKGMVINGSISAKQLNYPLDNEKNIYLLGNKYILLRKIFWEVPPKEIKNEIKDILVTFGGADPLSMVPKILRQLVNHFPKLTKEVVIGKSFQKQRIKALERIKDNNTELIYYPDAQKMKEIMLKSDVAISSGGQTIYELARVGLPTIAVATVNNQVNTLKKLEKVGCIRYAGLWKEYSLPGKMIYCLQELRSFVWREKLSKTGRNIITGTGSKLVVDYLISYYKKAQRGLFF